jgi:hypothetical protein
MNDQPLPPNVAVSEDKEPEISKATRELRNPTASVLSMLIPGAGHMVKGRQKLGIVLLLGGLFVLGWSVLLASGTYGLGLLLIPAYWLAVALHAFSIKSEEDSLAKRAIK